MKVKEINEGSKSRLYGRLTDDSSFAIVIPYRRDCVREQNEKRMAGLKNTVRNNLHLGFIRLVSRWAEDGISYEEESLLIPDISFEDAMELGREF